MGSCFSFWQKDPVPLLETCYWCKGRYNIDDLQHAGNLVMIGEPLFCIACRIKLGDISINTI